MIGIAQDAVLPGFKNAKIRFFPLPRTEKEKKDNDFVRLAL